VEETSSPLSSVNINVSDRELMYIYCQSSSLKPRARYSLLKNLIWLHFQNWHPEKGNCMNIFRIRRVLCKIWDLHGATNQKTAFFKKSAVCELIKKIKKVCESDNDPLMENLSSSLV
jgi:hypothetical protein